MPLKRIRIELARDHDYPEGNRACGYAFVAPLDATGRMDPDEWHKARKQCVVTRFWEGQKPELGHLVRKPGGRATARAIPQAKLVEIAGMGHGLPRGAWPAIVDAIVETAERHGVPHVTGATWTTDAIYRETRGKVDARVSEGCLTVEMESAAFFAVAAFRGVTFGQLLYAGDDLSGDAWDQRGWDEHVEGRELLFRLAAEAVLGL